MMSEIKFSDGIEKIKEDYNKIIYPEELLDKKCAGCVRCEKRNSYGRKKYGYKLHRRKPSGLPLG